MYKSELLPEPDGPTTPAKSRERIESDTSRTA
jgi:hypothetical protein